MPPTYVRKSALSSEKWGSRCPAKSKENDAKGHRRPPGVVPHLHLLSEQFIFPIFQFTKYASFRHALTNFPPHFPHGFSDRIGVSISIAIASLSTSIPSSPPSSTYPSIHSSRPRERHHRALALRLFGAALAFSLQAVRQGFERQVSKVCANVVETLLSRQSSAADSVGAEGVGGPFDDI